MNFARFSNDQLAEIAYRLALWLSRIDPFDPRSWHCGAERVQAKRRAIRDEQDRRHMARLDRATRFLAASR